MEEKWLIKELLLLQYHVAPRQSHPMGDIYQEGSSLPEVLGSSIRVSDSCEDIDHRPSCHLQEWSAYLSGSYGIFKRYLALFSLCVSAFV